MRALLDTHTFLWWITDDPRLSEGAREIISDGENELFLCAASGWEIAIKAKLGRLQLPDAPERFIPERMTLNAIESLPVQMSHALHVHALPGYHRHPFDRLLIAQAQLENLPILTADLQIAQYSVKVI
ncbi:MAG: type II toxin-antitoxin system VapC family toxin [Candidatus Acetothermia bacterium]|jgi:PIN domain nuclease of toxin-antitoxin system|nr:type II toxin-antitoxin system VapC family toxin [Candidatus Acetothermia bacterium]MDH7505863.1 type II toxin-antitoxin system VapC family toxin [Candidatus Acetothermia bacterium]